MFLDQVLRLHQLRKTAPRPKPKPVIQDIDPTDPAYSISKRRGRRSTILTSTTGASDELQLAKKTLLGG